MNIILTGHSGSGKTTIGKILAAKLNRQFIDLDILIEKQEKKTIREIFQQYGWRKFREIEKQAVKKMCQTADKAVIAVGGGTLMYKQNLCLIKNAKVVLLKTSFAVLARRLAANRNRPPLTKNQSSIQEIKKVWNRRKKRYFDIADLVVDSSDTNPQKAAREILEFCHIDSKVIK